MTQDKSSANKKPSAKKVLQTLVNIFFTLIFVSFFAILIYMGAIGLFRGHSRLETEASLVTKQAKKPSQPIILALMNRKLS